MPVIYCGLFYKQGPIVLAESTLTKSYSQRILNLIHSIYKGDSKTIDRIEIENDEIVIFCRLKTIVFICVSPSDEDKKTIGFMQNTFIPKIMTEFNKNIENITTPKEGEQITNLYHQNRLQKLLNTELDNLDTGILQNKTLSKITKEMETIKNDLKTGIKNQLKETENLESLLVTSNKLNEQALEYKDNSEKLEYETRCIKPWMIITGIVILILFIVYVVISLWRCGNLNIFCSKPQYVINEAYHSNLKNGHINNQ